jgi:hypothetical protein
MRRKKERVAKVCERTEQHAKRNEQSSPDDNHLLRIEVVQSQGFRRHNHVETVFNKRNVKLKQSQYRGGKRQTSAGTANQHHHRPDKHDEVSERREKTCVESARRTQNDRGQQGARKDVKPADGVLPMQRCQRKKHPEQQIEKPLAQGPWPSELAPPEGKSDARLAVSIRQGFCYREGLPWSVCEKRIEHSAGLVRSSHLSRHYSKIGEHRERNPEAGDQNDEAELSTHDSVLTLGVTPSSCCCFESDIHAGSRRKSDQHFKAESFPFAPDQVGNPGLTDAKEFRRLMLRKLLDLNEFPEIGHKIGTHLKNGGLLWGIPQINEYVPRRIDNGLVHGLPSNLLVSLASQIHILSARFASLLLKCMKHVNRIAKLGDIDYAPLPQYVNANLFCAVPNSPHWLPVAWLKSALNCMKIESCGPASFFREISEILQA